MKKVIALDNKGIKPKKKKKTKGKKPLIKEEKAKNALKEAQMAAFKQLQKANKKS
jgi:hypothetical protein